MSEREAVIKLRVAKADARALKELSGETKKFADESKRAGAAVADIVKEFKKNKDAEGHVERITAGLRKMRVEAGAARDAAVRLVKDLGDGARATNAEISRLASGLRATGHGATGGRFSGMGGMGLGGWTAAGTAAMIGRGAITSLGAYANSPGADEARAQFAAGTGAANRDYRAFSAFAYSTGIGQVADAFSMGPNEQLSQAMARGGRMERGASEAETRGMYSGRAAEARIRHQQASQAISLNAGMQSAYYRSNAEGAQFASGLNSQRTLEQTLQRAHQAERGGGVGGLDLAGMRRLAGDTSNPMLERDRAALAGQRHIAALDFQRAGRDIAGIPQAGAGVASDAANQERLTGAMQRQAEAAAKIRENEQASLELTKREGAERVAQLSSLRDSAKAMKEMYRNRKEAEEEKGKGEKRDLVMRDPGQIQAALRIAQRLNNGQEISRDALDFLGGIPGAEDIVNREKDRRLGGRDDIRQLRLALGSDKKRDDAAAKEEALAKFQEEQEGHIQETFAKTSAQLADQVAGALAAWQAKVEAFGFELKLRLDQIEEARLMRQGAAP